MILTLEWCLFAVQELKGVAECAAGNRRESVKLRQFELGNSVVY